MDRGASKDLGRLRHRRPLHEVAEWNVEAQLRAQPLVNPEQRDGVPELPNDLLIREFMERVQFVAEDAVQPSAPREKPTAKCHGLLVRNEKPAFDAQVRLCLTLSAESGTA